MRVVIAGSRKLPPGQGPRLLINTMLALPQDAIVLLRHPIAGEPGELERSVAGLAGVLGLRVEWWFPIPTESARGRASVYLRDINMVEKADLVLLFFTPAEAKDGYSGTAHMMEKALDADRPTYAYTVADDGKVERVGEYDPREDYASVVPAP